MDVTTLDTVETFRELADTELEQVCGGGWTRQTLIQANVVLFGYNNTQTNVGTNANQSIVLNFVGVDSSGGSRE